MDSSSAAAASSFLLTFLFIALFFSLFMIASMWGIFSKAGKPGWASIIPIYSMIVLLDIVGKPAWWIILLIIPGVNVIISIIVINELSTSFGKGGSFTLGLLFLGFIFFPMLAFGSARYIGPGGQKVA